MKNMLLSFLLFSLAGFSWAHETVSVSWPKLSEINETLGLAELAALQDRDPEPFLSQSFNLLGELLKEAPPKDAKTPLEVRSQLKQLLLVNQRDHTGSPAEKVQKMRPKVWQAMQKAGVTLYDEGPHHGWMIKLYSPEGVHSGWAEVKLHDDKGDIEVRYQEVEDPAKPLLLPPETVNVLLFPELKLQADLFVRNLDENEDEDGVPTLMNGETHYFIFPTREDQDPKPFLGKKFASPARLLLGDPSEPQLMSPGFLLLPHVHGAEGHHH
ncbi:hypothetical protein P0Y35_10860 [Kiritimatiellaeota bacterium B1221]|nr:hypothetical protein [Kiritimatiellaeota bacterium B1221]